MPSILQVFNQYYGKSMYKHRGLWNFAQPRDLVKIQLVYPICMLSGCHTIVANYSTATFLKAQRCGSVYSAFELTVLIKRLLLK